MQPDGPDPAGGLVPGKLAQAIAAVGDLRHSVSGLRVATYKRLRGPPDARLVCARNLWFRTDLHCGIRIDTGAVGTCGQL